MKRYVNAYGKVNLALCVGSRRPDGFHEIASIMQLLSLHDILELDLDIEPADKDESYSDVNVICEALPGGDTLVTRTIAALSMAAGVQVNGTVSITKHIPVGAGLGGGSSDAGSVLRALMNFPEITLSRDDAVRIASAIGSDVPFFVESGSPCFSSGRGEMIEPIDAVFSNEIRSLLLAWPGVEQNTANVYDRFEKKGSSGTTILPTQNEMVEEVSSGRFRNDLETAAVESCRELGLLINFVRASGHTAFVAGSGSTAVIVNPDPGLPDKLYTALGDRIPGLWLADATFINEFPSGT